MDISEINSKTDQKQSSLTDNYNVYLQVDDNNTETDTQVINVSINEEQNELENHSEILQLLNPDGTLTTVTKTILNRLTANHVNEQENESFKDFYTTVQAHKCSVCKCLCESTSDMTNHLKKEHPNLVLIYFLWSF